MCQRAEQKSDWTCLTIDKQKTKLKVRGRYASRYILAAAGASRFLYGKALLELIFAHHEKSEIE